MYIPEVHLKTAKIFKIIKNFYKNRTENILKDLINYKLIIN